MRRLRLLLPLLVLFGGCQCERVEDASDPGTPVAEAPAPMPVEEATDLSADEGAPDPAEPGFIEVYLSAVDLDGGPIPGVVPIVTQQPNAFDRPVAMGAPTDENGHARLRAPRGVHLYLRAWDHDQRYFAINYFDLLPGEGDRTDRLEVRMAQSAELTATVLDADGRPVALEPLRLMLTHPTAGPWWPAETVTTPDGIAKWKSVPPGSYTATFQSESGLQLEHPALTLPPGGATSLGTLTLQ